MAPRLRPGSPGTIGSDNTGSGILRGFVLRFRDDVRFGTRQFRRAPAYAVFTALVLALGIGTVTAMFTISYGVLLKPLPFRADRNLLRATENTPQGEDGFTASFEELSQWQRAVQGVADVGFAWGGLNILDAPGGTELVSAVSSSPNLFDVLGVRPLFGRGFQASEQETDHPDVVLLSYGMWQRGFGGDRGVVGRTVHIGGVLYTVVGVMPPQFEFPLGMNREEVWVPLDRRTMRMAKSDPYAAVYEPIIRLKEGVRRERIETALEQAHAPFRQAGEKSEIHLVRLHDVVVKDVQPALFALAIAVGIVWLIACSNVAGLMLARVASRQEEIAVRAALGAGRRRIISQFLTESLLLSAGGAVGGLGLAAVMLRIFRRTVGTMLPLGQDVVINWAVWLALVALTTVDCACIRNISGNAGGVDGSQSWAPKGTVAGRRPWAESRPERAAGDRGCAFSGVDDRGRIDDADHVRAPARAAGIPNRSPGDDELDGVEC